MFLFSNVISIFTILEIGKITAVTLTPNTVQSEAILDEREAKTQEKRTRIQHSSTKINIQSHGEKVKPMNLDFEFRNQSFGVLASPMYPMPYPGNSTVVWRVRMGHGSRIVLIIRQFILGPGDELRISNDRMNTTYTAGNSPEELLFLSTNSVDVTLTSSSALLKSFSTRTTTATTSGYTPKQRLFYAMFEREGCGGTTNRSHGYLTVPIYIHGTKRPHECVWNIETTQDKVVTLEFLDFDLPPGSCIYNNIYVRDGGWSGGYMLGQFCEENPPFSKLRTVTNTMTITYRVRPNLYEESRGRLNEIPYIKMFYRAVDNCGGDLEGYSGSFEAPTGWYNGISTCRWNIKVPESKIILLKITDWRSKKGKYKSTQSLEGELPIEHVQVSTNKAEDSVIWDSAGSEDTSIPDSLLIPSNQGVFSLSSTNPNTRPFLHFRVYFEAVLPLTGECFSIADKDFFMCHKETYIDCSKRCDGTSQCESGNDETDCPTIGVRRSFGPNPGSEAVPTAEGDDIEQEEDASLNNSKRRVTQRYALLWLTAMVVSATAIGSVFLIDQFMRRKPGNRMNGSSTNNSSSASNNFEPHDILPPPPPYKEFEDDEAVTMAVNGVVQQSGYSSRGGEEQSGISLNNAPTEEEETPPSYNHGGGGTAEEEDEYLSCSSAMTGGRDNEFISRTLSIPSIFQENASSLSSSNDGSSEMLNRPRHYSTPLGAPFYSSTSTLGSSESIPRTGLRNYRGLSSTDGSSESISRGGLHNYIRGSVESVLPGGRSTSQQIAALFHDTDVIESTATTITTPIQCFRFSDSMESHEEFIQQIRDFREPEV